MKFYGKGAVWDTRRNKRLCRFENGEVDIDNRADIGYMIKAGHPHEEIDYGDEVVEMTKNDVIEKLKAANIDHNPRDKKADLISLLDGE